MDDEPVSPALRVALGLVALLVLRWCVYGAVSMTTTKEIDARDKLNTLTEKSQIALRDSKWAEALAPLEELTKIQPKNHVYWWQRALVSGALHRPDDEAAAL